MKTGNSFYLLVAVLLCTPRLAVEAGQTQSKGTPMPDEWTIRNGPRELLVRANPFRITARFDSRPVLDTNAGVLAAKAAAWQSSTAVQQADRNGHGLEFQVSTTDPGTILQVTIAPCPGGFRLTARTQKASSMAIRFWMPSAGHWYGHGEARTVGGDPNFAQPWPLENAKVLDPQFGPASYYMIEPFWFTEAGTGIHVNTHQLMRVSLGADKAQEAELQVNDTASLVVDLFVEKDALSVYRDYVAVAGRPARSHAAGYQFRTPLWNSWAQFYTNVDQAGFLDYVERIHKAKLPGHTMSLDDGWMSHYGDFTFNSKFPDPKALSKRIHELGYRFGLWVTLWVNLDADNYGLLKKNGYLLMDPANKSCPCTVEWWNGKAGIVDIGNPAARKWYIEQLEHLQKTYGVDGFKFDTRFFDETCAPAPGFSARDYLKLGAELTGRFDQQGVGVRLHWTGSQREGFVVREADKGTDWNGLQVAIRQALAISTIGYPFVETDMVGGSMAKPPPSKEVLVRWAQAAALTPLVYCSTSPVRVYDFVNKKWVEYDAQTVELFRQALKLHEHLGDYIESLVKRAISDGEPIMRPLFFDFPDDKASYTISDEWLLGNALLAAPMLTAGTSRKIHLPPGRWYDPRQKRYLEGDQESYPAGLDTIPVFIRAGAPNEKELIQAVTAR
jgi:alpha-glucosidase (family GH31 glycosyl hydrolase)